MQAIDGIRTAGPTNAVAAQALPAESAACGSGVIGLGPVGGAPLTTSPLAPGLARARFLAMSSRKPWVVHPTAKVTVSTQHRRDPIERVLTHSPELIVMWFNGDSMLHPRVRMTLEGLHPERAYVIQAIEVKRFRDVPAADFVAAAATGRPRTEELLKQLPPCAALSLNGQIVVPDATGTATFELVGTKGKRVLVMWPHRNPNARGPGAPQIR